MAISISVVLLLVILTAAFLRTGGLKISHAVVCLLLGFFLAGTRMAPSIADGITATADVVNGFHP